MFPTRLRPFSTLLRWSAGLLLFSLTTACHADERYFLVVFGSERSVFRARYTHTWAVFVRACGSGPYPETYSLEWHTISWLPCSGDVELARALPEPGRNWGLHETFRLVYSNDEHVAQWGPYQIDKALYDRSLQQIAHLDSGKVHYKAVDTGYPTRRVSNCIHAVADVVGESPRLRVVSPAWGEAASYFILTRRLSPWIINPNEVYPWVGAALGLDNYPIIHRGMDRRPTIRERREPAGGASEEGWQTP
jgi:hypothetical protein